MSKCEFLVGCHAGSAGVAGNGLVLSPDADQAGGNIGDLPLADFRNVSVSVSSRTICTLLNLADLRYVKL